MSKQPKPPKHIYRPVEVIDVSMLFGPTPLLPGEDAAAYAQLQEALLAEHRPRTPYQKLLVQQLVEMEWNIMRRAAWMAELIAGKAEQEAIRHLAQSGLAMEEAREVGRAWRASLGLPGSPASLVLEAHGIRPFTLVAEARAALHEVVSDFEAENRRARHDVRLLQADLASLKRQARATDAPYVDVG